MKKSFKLFAAALMALAMFVPAQANELTVYDGTDQFECIPINAGFMDWAPYTVQMIYPAAQLEAMQGAEISSLKFYVANENGSGMVGGKMSIYIGTTDQSAFPSYSPSFIPTEDLTKVAEIAMTTGEKEVVADFDNPWTYAGGNLVVMTYLEEDGDYSGYTYFYGLNTTDYCSVYGRSYATAKNFGPKTTFTYEGGGEEPGIATLAQANALEDAAEFTFGGDAVVTVFNNGYLFLRDESGYGMIPGVTGEFANGQVLNEGWTATKTSENGWVRYTDAAGLSASGETNAELAAAQELTTVPNESMINAYVVYKNVTWSMFQRKITLEDGNTTVSVFDMFGINFPGGFGPDNRHWNVYGIIGKNGNNVVLYPTTSFVEYVEPPVGLRGDVNDDTNVNVADVAALINYLLTQDPSGVNLDNADCTLDEQVNVADIAALINYLLAGTW